MEKVSKSYYVPEGYFPVQGVISLKNKERLKKLAFKNDMSTRMYTGKVIEEHIKKVTSRKRKVTPKDEIPV